MPTTAMNMFRPTLFNTHCGRFGNAPEGGVLTAEPAEEQAGNQCAAACAQADGDAADMDGKCSEQTSDKDTKAYEYHIRLVGRAVYIPQTVWLLLPLPAWYLPLR